MFSRTFQLLANIGAESQTNNMATKITVDADRTGTLIMNAVIALQKFKTVQFKISSTVDGSYTVKPGSTLSIVVIGKITLLENHLYAIKTHNHLFWVIFK